MLYHDCCKIVGVRPDANLEQIRIAYRKKAKYIHPDINVSPNAHHDFIMLTKSFEYIKYIKQQEILIKMQQDHNNGININKKWDNFDTAHQLRKTRQYQTTKYKNINFKSTFIGRSIFITTHIIFLFIGLLITFNPLVTALKHGLDPNVSALSAITSATVSFTFGIIMCISIVLSGINLKNGF